MAEVSDVDYGPLKHLIGIWDGDKGMDIAPEPDGREQNPFYETIVFEAAGDVENAQAQTLAIVRYHQVVRRKSNDLVFHDQVGYWSWDRATQVLVESFVIPRPVAVVAGGTFPGDPSAEEIVLEVRAARGNADWDIIQSPFMRDNAGTESFEHRITLRGDQLIYKETTVVQIYGRSFEHTDENELRRRS